MELKPCPFCGGEIRIVRLHGSYGEPWYARCDRCEVSGYYYKTEDQAIEEWSVRPERTCHIDLIESDDENDEGVSYWQCTECYETFSRRISDPFFPAYFNYCPNCGAKVVEE